ncbi:MAG: c-type cytochrome [Simplicispira suum]|uniref:c-type cytochrome n=1 Tax=Simplicispira suum TaxID=2109915 RepID=UPI001C6B9DA0|nr:c-type cytochrome [Simplicispira suum]MBW7834666.1 c-type cytochrome [Simplicispira suum]
MKSRRFPLLLGLAAGLFATGASAAPDAAALARGEQVYARCAACHAIEANRTGPQHCGLFGRRAGTAPGYEDYSKAMRASTTVWDEKSLNVFLKDPMKVVPGTAMGYAGVKDDAERADLIAWLKQASRPGVECTVRP